MTSSDTARRPVPRLVRPAACGIGVVAAIAVAAGCGGATAGPATPGGQASPTQAPSSSAAPAAGPTPEISPAGDIPDSQVFVPFDAPDRTFSVSVPQGWARTADGAATVFSDKFNSVRIEQATVTGPVDVAAVRSRELPRLATSVAGYAPGDVRRVDRPSGPAVLATYSAASAPNPVTGKSVSEAVERYSFWRGDREVVLTLSGPTGADNVDPWRKITDSFRWR
jgi:hypothetical protein